MNLNPIDLQTLSRLLDQAMDLEVEQLDRWLAGLGEEHSRLIPHLREMLAQHRSQDQAEFMADGPRLADDTVARHGDLVGPYRLIREIGRGGMGTVWLAERADGSLKRQVALKLPRLAWGAGLAERMARERDIGALLEHPNIARLYDAGVDERGRPYLALEYIDGQPIDTWCTAKGLDVRAKLRLFVQVARAVAYAHGRLVVHRDLKPSNVLVTPDGQAHLLDFGIAKFLDDAAAADAGLTQDGGRVMTRNYASPEQVAGEAITVQSDVYSLGVLLYVLLTCELPIAPRRSTPGAVEDAILLGEVPRASSRVIDCATAKALRGEIDAILAKAMQRETARRYKTADELALDIERHLQGATVSAQPDRAHYRLRKALRRHWAGVSAAVVAAAAVGSGGTVALIQAQRAIEQAEHAKLVTEFVADVFRVGAQRDDKGRPEDLLDQGTRLIRTRFPGRPDIEADLYGVVGRIYADLGANQAALECGQQQLRLLKQLASASDRTARAHLLMAVANFQDGQDEDAEIHAGRAAAMSAVDPSLRSDALVFLARIQLKSGKVRSAHATMTAADRQLAARGNPENSASAWLIWLKGYVSDSVDGTKTAREQALEMALRAEGSLSPTAIDMRLALSRWLTGIHRFEEGRKHLDAALSALRKKGGAHQIRAAIEDASYWSHLAFMRGAPLPEAMATIRRDRDAVASLSPAIPPVVLAKLDYALATAQADWGDFGEANRLLQRSVPVLLASTRSISQRFEVLVNRSELEVRLGNHDAAAELLRERLELRHAIGGADSPFAAFDWAWAAMNFAMSAKLQQASNLLSKAPTFGRRESDAVAGDVFERIIPLTLARIRLASGDVSGATSVLPPLPSDTLPDDEGLFAERALHGEVLCASGAREVGLAILLESIRTISTYVSDQEPGLARLRSVAGLCSLDSGDRVSATTFAAQARAAFAAQPGVSPYFKLPLMKLERALSLKKSPT